MPGPNYSVADRQDVLHTRAKQMLRELSGLYLTDADRAMSIARETIEIARAIDDKKLTGRTLLEMSKAVRQKGDMRAGLTYVQQAVAIFETLHDTEDLPKALQSMGTFHSAAGEFVKATECFARALPLAKANDDTPTLERIWNSWGIVYIRIGDYAEALKAFEECLRLLQTYPDLYLESSILLNIGAIFQRSGDLDMANDYCQRSLALGRELSDHRHIASTLIFLGDTHLIQQKRIEARSYLREALSISETNEASDLIAQSLKSLAELASESGQPEEALHHLTRAREILIGSANRIHLQKVEQELGALFLKVGKLDKAESSLERALELAREIGSPQLLYEVNVLCSELSAKQLDYKTSNSYLHEALEQHKLLFSESNQKALRDMEVRLAIEAKRKAED